MCDGNRWRFETVLFVMLLVVQQLRRIGLRDWNNRVMNSLVFSDLKSEVSEMRNSQKFIEISL